MLEYASSRRLIHPARASLALCLALVACGGGGGTGTGGSGGAGGSGASSSSASSGGGGASSSSAGGAATSSSSSASSSSSGGDALVTGAGYAMSYAAGDGIGIDTRPSVTATFDPLSALTGYVVDVNAMTMMNECPTLGTNTVIDVGHTIDIGWGRWHGGTTGGNFYGKTYMFAADQGFHYVIAPTHGLPSASSGSATYAMIGSTPPTLADGSAAPGSFTGSLIVEYGNPPKIGVKLEPTAGGVPYVIQSSSFPAASNDFSVGPAGAFGGTIATTGAGFCGGSCKSFVQGFFAKSGDIIGIAYQIGVQQDRISGVAAFAKQ